MAPRDQQPGLGLPGFVGLVGWGFGLFRMSISFFRGLPDERGGQAVPLWWFADVRLSAHSAWVGFDSGVSAAPHALGQLLCSREVVAAFAATAASGALCDDRLDVSAAGGTSHRMASPMVMSSKSISVMPSWRRRDLSPWMPLGPVWSGSHRGSTQ